MVVDGGKGGREGGEGRGGTVRMDAWRRVSRRRWEGQHYKKWWWMEGKVFFISSTSCIIVNNTV